MCTYATMHSIIFNSKISCTYAASCFFFVLFCFCFFLNINSGATYIQKFFIISVIQGRTWAHIRAFLTL